MRVAAWPLVAGAALVIAACNGEGTAPNGASSLTITGSTHATASFRAARSSARAASFGVTASDTMGDPSSIKIGLYALWISQNADCSNAVLVQDNGATAQYKDFVAKPTLFTGSPAVGSYSCVAIKMSDVIKFEAASAFGECATNTEYAIDIYRSDNTGDPGSEFKDVNLNPIAASGTDAAPADDRVTIVMTRDPEAAIARGFSPNQVIPLGSNLAVPGSSTFVWGGAGTVRTEPGQGCGLEPGAPSFE